MSDELKGVEGFQRSLNFHGIGEDISGGDGFYVGRLTASGANLNDGVIDAEDGAKVTLNIVAGDDVGNVKGFVK